MKRDVACLYKTDGPNFTKPPGCPSGRQGTPDTVTSSTTITDTTAKLVAGT